MLCLMERGVMSALALALLGMHSVAKIISSLSATSINMFVGLRLFACFIHSSRSDAARTCSMFAG